MKWNCSGTTIDVPFIYFMIHLSISVNCLWIAFTRRFCTLWSIRENTLVKEQWWRLIFSHSSKSNNTHMHICTRPDELLTSMPPSVHSHRGQNLRMLALSTSTHRNYSLVIQPSEDSAALSLIRNTTKCLLN